jgi:hypothetical protein
LLELKHGSPNTTHIRKAEPPFDEEAADIIIRSSDNEDFYVFKYFLAYSSSVFQDMFHVARGEPGSKELKDDLQVICTEESAETWKILLRLSYPVWKTGPNRGLNSLDEVSIALEPVRKYGMEKVELWIRERVIESQLMQTGPIRVFSIACHYEWEAEARAAAKQLLHQSMCGDAYFPGLGKITAGDYHRLLQYHRECGKVASDVASNLSWIVEGEYPNYDWEAPHKPKCGTVEIDGGTQITYAPTWWFDYTQAAAKALKDCPLSAIVTIDSELMKGALSAADLCPACRIKASADMKVFAEKFTANIDQAVSKVSRGPPSRSRQLY